MFRLNGVHLIASLIAALALLIACSPVAGPLTVSTPTALTPTTAPPSPMLQSNVGKSISGRVLWGTRPVAGARVELRQPGWRSGDGVASGPLAQATSDTNGHYVIKEPPVGEFALVAVWPDGTDSNGVTPPVTIAAGQELLDFDLHLEKELRLIAPVSGALVGPSPVLHWDALPEAASYKVLVLDAGTTEVMMDIPTQETSLALQRALEPGRTYQWVVTALGPGEVALAHLDGEFIVSPDGLSDPDPLAPTPTTPGHMPALACTTDTHYADQVNRYCFQYPERFEFKNEDNGLWVIYGPPLDDSPDPLRAALAIEVRPAHGQTLAQAVEAFLEENSAPTLVTTRTDLTLGGETAVMLEPVAGRPTYRAVIAIHADRLFILRFSPDTQTFVAARDDVTELYEVVMKSFTYLPTYSGP
jgi:hypothetical protein